MGKKRMDLKEDGRPGTLQTPSNPGSQPVGPLPPAPLLPDTNRYRAWCWVPWEWEVLLRKVFQKDRVID